MASTTGAPRPAGSPSEPSLGAGARAWALLSCVLSAAVARRLPAMGELRGLMKANAKGAAIGPIAYRFQHTDGMKGAPQAAAATACPLGSRARPDAPPQAPSS